MTIPAIPANKKPVGGRGREPPGRIVGPENTQLPPQ